MSLKGILLVLKLIQGKGTICNFNSFFTEMWILIYNFQSLSSIIFLSWGWSKRVIFVCSLSFNHRMSGSLHVFCNKDISENCPVCGDVSEYKQDSVSHYVPISLDYLLIAPHQLVSLTLTDLVLCLTFKPVGQ